MLYHGSEGKVQVNVWSMLCHGSEGRVQIKVWNMLYHGSEGRVQIKVWSMLYHGSEGRVQIKENYLTFTFFAFFAVFHQKMFAFVIFDSLDDEVSN